MFLRAETVNFKCVNRLKWLLSMFTTTLPYRWPHRYNTWLKAIILYIYFQWSLKCFKFWKACGKVLWGLHQTYPRNLFWMFNRFCCNYWDKRHKNICHRLRKTCLKHGKHRACLWQSKVRGSTTITPCSQVHLSQSETGHSQILTSWRTDKWN